MTSRTRHNQHPGEPRPDPRLEQLIREAVASQHVPLARQQRHLARIRQQGQASAAMNPWSASDTRQRASLAGDSDAPHLPALGQRGPSVMLPPTRTRRRQVTELAFGLVGFVVVAALLVALFREEPDASLGATDSTSTPTATAATTPTPTTVSATATVPVAGALTETPSAQPSPTPVFIPPMPEPTPTSIIEVPLTNEQALAGYGVLTRWDAKVYNLAALTVGPDDRVYAVDMDTGQASIYTLEETLIGSFDLTGFGALVDGRYDLAVDGNGTLYLLARVLNSGASDVYRYPADGSDIGTSLWLANSEPLVNALALAVSDDGLLYVAENLPNGNGRIRTFNTDGLETARWEDAGDAPIPDGIQSIEVTDDAVYILVDSHDSPGSILQFNLDGTFAGTLVTFASNADDAERPLKRSFAVDPAGNVFVADPEDGSVTGYFLTSEASGMLLHWSPDDGVESEREPNTHVAVDSRGYVYILQSDRVMMTVLAPPEVIEEARTPTLSVSPDRGTCADEWMAHGSQWRAGDRVTIRANVSGTDEYIQVGEAAVMTEGDRTIFDAPLNLEPLGICEGEIDLAGVEITLVAEAEGDPKEALPTTFTLYSAEHIATLTLSPTTADCDTPVTASGTNFIPGTTVTLRPVQHSPNSIAWGVPVDENGAFSVEVSLETVLGCEDPPFDVLPREVTIIAETEWQTKQAPYPSARGTFMLTEAE